MNTRNYKFVTLAVLVFLFFNFKTSAQVGIGTNAPNANAMLDVESTTKGFLPPRMSTAEKTTLEGSLGTGDAGMTVYDTDLVEYNVWDGSAWVTMSGGSGASSRALGNIYFTSAANVTLSSGGVKLTGATTAVNTTADFGPSSGRLTYVAADSKVFSINASISFSSNAGGAAQEDFTFYIVKSGTLVPGTSFDVSKPALVGAGNLLNISISGTVSLDTGNNIEIWGSNSTGVAINITNYNIVLQEL